MPSTAKPRIAFVNTHPIQYFAPLYRYLTQEAGFDVTALYLSDSSLRGGYDKGFGQSVTWDVDLINGYSAVFMGARAKRRTIGGYFSMVAPELWAAIVEGNFDALIIHGHNLAAHQVAIAAALRSGTPVFQRCETHTRLQRPKWKEVIRYPLIRAWYRAFDGFLAIGSANRRYYEHMGVEVERIFSMPYTVDNDRFTAEARSSLILRDETHRRLGLKSKAPVIISAAKFNRRKNPDVLLSAFHQLQNDGIDCQLVLAGSGAMESELKRRVQDHGIENVVFPGFINQSELPRVYAACDIFVLPSENEPWGLTVNEAMCAGLPIVISREIGCADDLVQQGVNGALVEAGNASELVAALRPLITDPEYRQRCGRASQTRIAAWSYAECASGLRTALAATPKRSIEL